jgi:tetratricopeptide (TPR) repeat protein
MRPGLAFAAVPLIALTACRPVRPAAPPPGPSLTQRLAAADALLREGCLDCLLDAYRHYDAIRTAPGAPEAAGTGALQAAGLIALRERELGMVDDGYLERARGAVAPGIGTAERDTAAIDAIDVVAVPLGSASGGGSARLGPSAIERARWLDLLRTHADENALSAAAWVAFSCLYNPERGQGRPEMLRAPLARFSDAAVVVYEIEVCAAADRQVLESLESANPRFVEVEYTLALRDIGARQLDSAEARLTKALAWHAAWPAAMIRLANIEMTAEAFDAALDLYERALALVPQNASAMLGRIQALSYLSRHEEAIARSTELLKTPNLPGDAYYWRAWNEYHLERLDEAWDDVEQAERLWRNSDVFMLAGLVAYKKQQLDVAKTKFKAVLAIEPSHCDALFFLGSVNSDLATWPDAAEGFAASGQCYGTAQRRLASEIDRLQRSGGRPDRVARQVASREAQRATARSLQRQSWFNGAVADLRLGRKDEARQLAGQLVDDEQFGERARQILSAAR